MTKAIGNRVRRKRLELGLTQVRLAARIKAYPSEISDLEAGRRNFSAGRLKRLARALRVSTDWIMGMKA